MHLHHVVSHLFKSVPFERELGRLTQQEAQEVLSTQYEGHHTMRGASSKPEVAEKALLVAGEFGHQVEMDALNDTQRSLTAVPYYVALQLMLDEQGMLADAGVRL